MNRRSREVVESTQGSLLPTESQEPDDLWRKTVKVVHSVPRGHSLTVMQRKIANAWMKHAIENPRGRDGWWQMPLMKLRQETGFGSSHNTKHLKESAKALMRIIFEFDVFAPGDRRTDEWQAQVLFHGVALSRGYIRWQISDNIYRELLRPEVYALINMSVMRRFTTAAALQLWEFCVRFENIGLTKKLRWEELRDTVLDGAGKASFADWKVLKKRALVPAIAEINTCSDHDIELIEFRDGRRMAEVQFRVTRKKQDTRVPLEAERLVERIVRLGVPAIEAKRMASLYPVPRLHAALQYTELRQTDAEQAPLESPAAYFRRALELGWGYAGDIAAPQVTQATGPVAAAAANDVGAPDASDAAAAKRRELARAHYDKQSPTDKETLRERYNAQQRLPNLRVKARVSKMTQVAFLNWLARELWGDGAQDVLL
ncbi:replication initiation protein [Azohydromonas australica]|uniref:replication initiation protein n=1 Tax=Azohydromonas australica TaxID=364039 RepID=UPI0004062470|nr:replication initiation protein [Azohydromonas australica]